MSNVEIKEGLSRMMKLAEKEKNFTGYSGLADRLCKMESYYVAEQIEHKIVSKEEIVERVRLVSPLIAAKLAMATPRLIEAEVCEVLPI